MRSRLEGVAPRDDLISALLAAQEHEGTHLTDDEAVGVVRLLLVAGNITTMDLIENELMALLRHPDQNELLRNDATLVERAVEEMLRYDPPIVATDRVATSDVSIAGCPMKRGEWITPAFRISVSRIPRHHPRTSTRPASADSRPSKSSCIDRVRVQPRRLPNPGLNSERAT